MKKNKKRQELKYNPFKLLSYCSNATKVNKVLKPAS